MLKFWPFPSVMGPTGAGKSTVRICFCPLFPSCWSFQKFIERATGHDGKTIGHKLRSFTSDIRTVRTTHPTAGYPVLLVDTPGFDDTYRSDVVILVQIADFLVKMSASYFRSSPITKLLPVMKDTSISLRSCICIRYLIIGWPGRCWRISEFSSVYADWK